MSSGCTVAIVTRDASTYLSRLLTSVRNNAHLQNSPIVIVDDSSDPSLRRMNRQIATEHNAAIIDEPEWQRLADMLTTRIDEEAALLIKSLTLGSHTWNTPAARNVFSVYRSLAVSPEQRILHLDTDMVVPAAFVPSDAALCGYALRGSPDFSRLEWIELFLGLESRTHRVPFEPPSRYVSHVLNTVPGSTVRSLLGRYTDLVEESGPDVPFPQRNELSGGAYTSSNTFPCYYFPFWYNEDWFWFQKACSDYDVIPRIEATSLIHAASMKTVLDRASLLREEEGKLLTRCYEGNRAVDDSRLELERRRRLDIVQRDLECAKRLTARTQGTKKCLAALEALHAGVLNLALKGNIERYESESRIWRSIMKAVSQEREILG